MILAALVILSIVFIEAVFLTRLPGNVRAMFTEMNRSMAILGSSEYDDDAKEAAARRGAGVVFLNTGLFTLKFVVIAALIAGAAVAFASAVGVDTDELVATTLSWPVLIGLTVLGMGYVRVRYGRIG